jgi:peroxiredoxin
VFARISAATVLGLGLVLALSACEKTDQAADAQISSSKEVKTPEKAANFVLTDHTGKSHELYKMTDAKAVVMVMQGVGCPIVQKMTPDLKAVQAAYEGKGVKFLMLNANNQDTRQAIAAEAESFSVTMPILKDEGQKVAEPMGVVRTAEVFVIQPKTWKIVYHGPLNDRLTYGREKAKASNNYVADVLDAALAGKATPVSHQMTDGCIIDFPARNKTG